MAVELYDLYKEIYSDYEVKLLTSSCFDRKIDWMHTIENDDFAYLLHGGELIFNSSLNFESEEVQKRYIDNFISMNAGGLIVAMQEKKSLSPDLIDYCNEKQFPLFLANWETSFVEITRKFSSILLINERNETNLIGALKNAIHSPLDEDLYLSCFERNMFFRDMDYTISILGNISDSKKLKLLKTSLQYAFKKSIIYRENQHLVILTNDYSFRSLTEEFRHLLDKEPGIQIGIGSSQKGHMNISRSYKHAKIAFELMSKTSDQNILCYNDLGIYQLLTDIAEPNIYADFVRKTLGPLIEYDAGNQTNYMEILECFFENECHLANTADAMFFHKNTLKYKLAKIKDILGCDILSNQNRMNIMIAFHILKIGIEYYT